MNLSATATLSLSADITVTLENAILTSATGLGAIVTIGEMGAIFEDASVSSGSGLLVIGGFVVVLDDTIQSSDGELGPHINGALANDTVLNHAILSGDGTLGITGSLSAAFTSVFLRSGGVNLKPKPFDVSVLPEGRSVSITTQQRKRSESRTTMR